MNHQTPLSIRLKQLRTAHAYTQDYVASVLGIIRQTYSHYETGRCVPPTAALYQIAQLYRISVEELLRMVVSRQAEEFSATAGDAPSSVAEQDLELEGYLAFYNDRFNREKYRFFSDEEKELLYYFSRINETDRREIIEFTKIKARKYE
ncbi:MAG: helix-turn-helix transcriptional regulator [Lachnospiraceae bacterium]|nr:helix-turn-helix transcriptional regulator [Lachnospiraceae bacterium]